MGSCEACKYQNKTECEEPCKGCTHNATDNYEPMTNADRIRSMSDEELAEWLDENTSSVYIHSVPCEECVKEMECVCCLLEWLKSEE